MITQFWQGILASIEEKIKTYEIDQREKRASTIRGWVYLLSLYTIDSSVYKLFVKILFVSVVVSRSEKTKSGARLHPNLSPSKTSNLKQPLGEERLERW